MLSTAAFVRPMTGMIISVERKGEEDWVEGLEEEEAAEEEAIRKVSACSQEPCVLFYRRLIG